MRADVTGAVTDAVVTGMFVGVRWLDNRGTGPAKDRRWIAVELDLVDEHLDPGDDDALQRRALADGALGEQLEAELEAVGNDALLLADAHDDAASPCARLPCRSRPS